MFLSENEHSKNGLRRFAAGKNFTNKGVVRVARTNRD